MAVRTTGVWYLIKIKYEEEVKSNLDINAAERYFC
jgi:hypothetical protein